jgi:signal transduction histidine kinase
MSARTLAARSSARSGPDASPGSPPAGLAENRLFRGLPPDALAAACAVPVVVDVPDGRVVFDEGDPPDRIYLIAAGAVRISKRGRGGAQETLATLRRGDFFGEMALYDARPRSARATAAGPARLAAMDRAGLERVMRLAPLEVSRNVVEGLVARLRETDTSLIRQALREERLGLLGSAAAAIVHDLRNPIGVVHGAATLLAGSETDPRRTRMLGLIRRSVDRVLEMVREILDFSAGETRLAPERVSVPALLARVEEEVLFGLASRGVRLETRIDCGGDVMADVNRLLRVFENLVRNALEAMPDGGTLTLAAELRGGEVAFRVADTGRGIPEELQATVFEPFASYAKVSGTGLGMAIVKSIVDAHGGRIRVESRVGAGAAFEFTLPAAREDPGGADRPAPVISR